MSIIGNVLSQLGLNSGNGVGDGKPMKNPAGVGGELTPGGGLLGGGLMAPRDEGLYGGVDWNHFRLPGAGQMLDRNRALGELSGQRGAPQSADNGPFRGMQENAAFRLNQQMLGNDSLSNLALRKSTDANIAQQRALAASATPGNAAMAQRMAGQNIARANQGFGSQAAALGIQERNAAANALGMLASQGRGQDLQNNQFNVGAQLQQTGLNDQAQNNAYNRELATAGMIQGGNMGYEQQRTQRAAAQLGVPTSGEQTLGMIMGGLGLASSDVRMKQNIHPGGQDANQFMDSLSPASYQYKPGAGMPPGQHTGVMAQQLEQTPAGRGAVINTPQGKMVDYGQLGGVTMASLASLNDRLRAIEEGTKGVAARTKQSTGKSATPRQDIIREGETRNGMQVLSPEELARRYSTGADNYDRARSLFDKDGNIVGRERAPIRGR